MSSEFSTRHIVFASVSGVIAILIGVNSYFIKGLVDKIDKITDVQERLGVLETKVDFMISGLRGENHEPSYRSARKSSD